MAVARDVMETRVVRVGAEDPLPSVYRLFYDEEISGAPVVDDTGQVVGVVSASDLIRVAREERDALRGLPDFYRDGGADARSEWFTEQGEYEDRLAERRVSDVMTSHVVSVTPDTPIPMVAKVILNNRIHRVLVLEEKEGSDYLVGIITLFDLVALLQ